MSYSSTVLADAPLAYYRLGEASGATVVDSSGHTQNGTYNGGVTYNVAGAVAGDTNTAVALDGSTGYIGVNTAVTSDNRTAFSIELAFRTVSSASADMRIVANSHTDADNKGIQLAVNPGSASGFFSVGFGTSNTTKYWGSTPINSGAWLHLVGVFDGTSVLVYLNGAVLTSGLAVGTTIAASGFPINVGRNPVYNGDYYTGSVDEIAFYGTGLTATQVKNHYAALMQTFASDTATGSDTATILVPFAPPDASSGSDVAALLNVFAPSDPALGTESLSIQQSSTRTPADGITLYTVSPSVILRLQ